MRTDNRYLVMKNQRQLLVNNGESWDPKDEGRFDAAAAFANHSLQDIGVKNASSVKPVMELAQLMSSLYKFILQVHGGLLTAEACMLQRLHALVNGCNAHAQIFPAAFYRRSIRLLTWYQEPSVLDHSRELRL